MAFDESTTPDEQQIEEGDLIPVSFINSHRERLYQLLEQKKHEMLLEDPTLTEEKIQAQVKTVDMYLRLSQEKNKKKPHELPAYLAERIPQRKARKRNETTTDSMIAQFLECAHRIER